MRILVAPGGWNDVERASTDARCQLAGGPMCGPRRNQPGETVVVLMVFDIGTSDALSAHAARVDHPTTCHRVALAVLAVVRGHLPVGAVAGARLFLLADDAAVVHSRAALVGRSLDVVAGRRVGDRADDRRVAGKGASAPEA